MKLVFQLSDGVGVIEKSTQLAIADGVNTIHEAMDRIQVVVPEACMGQEFDFHGANAPDWMKDLPVTHF